MEEMYKMSGFRGRPLYAISVIVQCVNILKYCKAVSTFVLTALMIV